jgi:RNA polymerase sigma factor (TIGR02999 family)
MSQITDVIESADPHEGVPINELWPAAYDDLRKLARSRLRDTGQATLLDTTSLVNDSYLKLADSGALKVVSRAKFFAYASCVMRSVIVDLVRERLSARRGGGAAHLTLSTTLVDSNLAADDEALRLNDALNALAKVEPRLASVVEMRYFGGLTEMDIGQVLSITERTVRRDWEKARVLLRVMLSET